MLTVWCVRVGDKYTKEDVLCLERQVAAHLSEPYVFVCLSDTWDGGYTTMVPGMTYPGWWSKLCLFDVSRKSRSLYLDLDVVVVGPLDGLISDGPLTMPKNWAQSGHGGWQSSVMSWHGDFSHIYKSFDVERLSPPDNGNFGWYEPEHLWGDQEFITHVMGDSVVPMEGVYSYKYHCRDGLPDDAVVVAFHGQPKPADVSDPWVLAARSM